MSESLIVLCFLKRLALKVFKNLVLLKVQMWDFDMGSPIQERRALKYDRGHSKCFFSIRNIIFPMFFGAFFTLGSQNVGFPSAFWSVFVKNVFCHLFLNQNRFRLIKNLVFLKVGFLKNTTVQAISRVKITKYQFYNIKRPENDTEPVLPEPAEPPDPDRGLHFGTYHPHAPESGWR